MKGRKKHNSGIVMVTIALFFLSTVNVLAFDVQQQQEKMEIKISTNSPSVINYMGNVQISSDPLDEQHPTITAAPDGSILVAYDRQVSALEGHIYFMRSIDGNTWSEIYNTNTGDMAEGMQNWPGLIVPPGSNILYGVWNDDATNYQYVMYATDPADPSTWDIGYLDQSGQDYDRVGYDMAAIDETTWGWCFIGHVEYAGYDLPRAIESEFGLGTWEEVTFSWTGDQYYPTTYNSDIAATTNNFWIVWEFYNESHPKKGIGIHWGNPNEEGDIALWPVTTIEGAHNYADPTVGASGNNICIVYMTNDNIYGDFDLACKYSTDEGNTWQDSTLPSLPQVDEKSPEIFVSGSTVFCTFVRNGNLYLTKSTDLGATWEEPEQINDQDGTVVDELGAVEISPAGIVWVDTRNGNKDIYYAPLPTAILNVEAISGGMGITATITNTGTEDATGVAWSIDVSGLVFVGKHTEGTIDIPAGSEATISSGMVFGIGPGTITVTVGGVSRTASCFILGPLVLGV